ncbi:MAG: hypothetical protein NTY38_24980 [Acidobacteria bacterium]|nr:hypothetical protein [Acidobacteriota bacterium]
MSLPIKGSLETILLVEDHSALLKLVKQILEDADFTVIPARSAKQAIQLEAEFPGTIDRLLRKKLKERRPQMRVVLMSGYPGGALLVLNYGWHYIEKPFVATVLVSRLKDILRGEAREQSTDRFDTLKVPRETFERTSLNVTPIASSQARRRA